MNIFKTKKSSSKLFGIVPLEYSLDRKNTRYQKLSRTRAFTLIELLVVISIIGFLSSVVLASTKTAREKAQDSKIAQDLRQFGIAVQLYYDDHQTYNFALGGEDKSLAVNEAKENFSIKDLNIFSTKIVEAYNDPKCSNFVTIGNILVQHKYLSSVPKHPKDNGATICYKAATTTSNFTAYTDFSTSKRVGVILGDITVANLVALNNITADEYPRDTTGGDITSLALIGDAVLGLTGGSGTLITGYTLNVSNYQCCGLATKYPDKATYNSGDSVIIKAYPDTDYSFVDWYDELGNVVSECNSNRFCTIQIVNSNKTVRPNFIYAPQAF
jgi:prepilin-type N-terminal cleavage/methylation domain-containing protein